MQGTGSCKDEGRIHFPNLNGCFTRFIRTQNSTCGLFIHHFRKVIAKKNQNPESFSIYSDSCTLKGTDVILTARWLSEFFFNTCVRECQLTFISMRSLKCFLPVILNKGPANPRWGLTSRFILFFYVCGHLHLDSFISIKFNKLREGENPLMELNVFLFKRYLLRKQVILKHTCTQRHTRTHTWKQDLAQHKK